jgi:hypothetical protein
VIGYLQRLASSVSHPGGNIRPVLDTVFSAPKARTNQEALEISFGSAETHDDIKPRTDKPAPPERSVSREPTALLPADDSEQIQLLAPIKEAKSMRETPKSLIPQHLSQVLRPTSSEPPVDGKPESAEEMMAVKEAPERQLNERGPELSVKSTNPPLQKFTSVERIMESESLEPLVPTTVSVARPAVNRPHSAFHDPRSRTGLNSFPAPNISSREPDEIEIHIGRIEVTAAQATRPQAPAKPRNLAPSLGEYLRRRDRRNS